ncbi:MAG TPA: adenosine deaminase [Saprospiraceae bacterium]|nr:adenosine deaminase [Saprospiraceae bacterium]
MTEERKQFIAGMPKAELHLHIEGSFEPELMFEIARRNQVEIKFDSVEEVKKAYDFSNLQDFLDIYYEGAQVLLKEQDFFDLTWAYLRRIHAQNVIHTEIFFDPQTHTDRGVPFEIVLNGITSALDKAKNELGITNRLIMCFLRHLDESEAEKTLEMALPFKDKIYGVGLDSSEMGHPPSKFQNVFAKAIKEGFVTVAHAGEEGPAQYIWEALDLLHISRLDHGNRSIDDPKLMQRLAAEKMALTVCPLSNLKLCVVDDLKNHPLRKLMQNGLKVTINSDDPAYFGGYMNENFWAIADALDLSKDELYTLLRNAFEASFVSDERKQEMIGQLDAYFEM